LSIHVVCGRVLEEDEGRFKADSVVCPWCNPQKQQQPVLQPNGKGLLLHLFFLRVCFLIHYLVLLRHYDQQNNSNRSPQNRENSRKEGKKVESGRIHQSLLQENQQTVIEMKE
jgi:hypothetical protein